MVKNCARKKVKCKKSGKNIKEMNPNLFLRRMGISVVFRGVANAAVLYLIIKNAFRKRMQFLAD